jgi:hypothetical protein
MTEVDKTFLISSGDLSFDCLIISFTRDSREFLIAIQFSSQSPNALKV